MDSKASFKVYYSGIILESGQMDVRELAPALLAMGSLLEESNRVLNDGKTEISVKVKKFEDGSFGISFEVIQGFATQLIELWSGKQATAAANMVQIIGFSVLGFKGLFYLIKKAKGRVPRKAKILEDGNVEIDFSDNSEIVSKPVFDLYRDIKVRQQVENVLKPLAVEGIDNFQVKDGENVVESVNKSELKYFQTPEIDEEIIQEKETVAMYTIHSLSFKEDNKWLLSDGTNTFFVTIKDEDFLRKVNENLISFSKGDILTLNLKIITWETKDGIKTEYEASKVVDHKSASRQLKLPLE
ncbi:MAG: hypothetical protein CVU52_01490 [Deltaproteobacteria bacterium HGW-Deltaproteobacteria-10]|nr:MAG: hypothetical protein CVU52_01490 [Deltaproteobacteria bacterium HGW-Deltaproteobacteria-10]